MGEQPVLVTGLLIGNDYWCVFLGRYSSGTFNRRRDFSCINRKILNENKWLFIAGLSGFCVVTIGAFAAHGLSKVLEPKELAWIETV